MTMTATEPSAPIINNLMHGELQSAALYLQAAGWCAQHKLDGCTRFFMAHAFEEMKHMRRLLQYMIDTDLPADIAAVEKPKITVNDVKGLLGFVYEHEKAVTRGIFDALSKVEAAGDHSTFEALQWFVAEQREEEKLFRELVDRIGIIGEGPHSTLFIDQAVAEAVPGE